MSKDIDFEFGRSIGATHYFNGFQFAFVKKISDDNYQYYDEIRRKWFGVINGKAVYEMGNLSEVPPANPWTIHNNDKPLCELSDEQAAKLFNAWRVGIELQYKSEDGFSRSLGGITAKDAIYRIKPKSERDEFVDMCMNAAGQEPLTTGMGFKNAYSAIFDAIQRGDIKAPEVK